MTLKELKPFDSWEQKVIDQTDNEQDAVAVIISRRKYMKDNLKYIASLMRIQFRARFAPRNEKPTPTMQSYYKGDFINATEEE